MFQFIRDKRSSSNITYSEWLSFGKSIHLIIFSLSVTTNFTYSSISLSSNCVWIPLFSSNIGRSFCNYFHSVCDLIFHLRASYLRDKLELLLHRAFDSLSQLSIYGNWEWRIVYPNEQQIRWKAQDFKVVSKIYEEICSIWLGPSRSMHSLQF